MKHTVKPEKHQLQKARTATETALKTSKTVLQKQKSLKIELGYNSSLQHGAATAYADAKIARIEFNPEKDSWTEDLQKTVVDAYGRAYYAENTELNFKWQQLLSSTTGLLLNEQLGEQKHVEKNLKQEWRQKKDSLDKKIQRSDQRYSWQLKLKLGRKLIEEHDLENLPELKRSQLLNAAEQLLGE